MKDLFISLISGLIGVLVGAVIQLIYDYFSNKRQIRDDYKKECISEWLSFRYEIKEYLTNFDERNNIYFRQSFLIKTDLLKSIGNSKDSIKAVEKICSDLKDKDEKISLAGTAEEAFKEGAKLQEQKIFQTEVYTIISDTIKAIQAI